MLIFSSKFISCIILGNTIRAVKYTKSSRVQGQQQQGHGGDDEEKRGTTPLEIIEDIEQKEYEYMEEEQEGEESIESIEGEERDNGVTSEFEDFDVVYGTETDDTDYEETGIIEEIEEGESRYRRVRDRLLSIVRKG